MAKIFIASRSFGKVVNDGVKILQGVGEVMYNPHERSLNSSELKDYLKDASAVILGNDVCDADVLNSTEKLKVVSRHGVGVDNVDLKAATENGIIVTNTPKVNTTAVAEHTLALMMALLRRIPQANLSMKSKRWEGLKFVGEELTGKKLGIIGLGSIGKEVAKRAKALGMKVLYSKRTRDVNLEKELGLTFKSLNELLKESDIISIHIPLTSETKGLIGKKEIALMKRGSYIINTARGGIIETEALIEALRNGHLAGVALDVFDKEPPDFEIPLFTLDNVITTPQIGAYTIEAIRLMDIIAAENVVNVLQGRIPEYVVNREVLSKENLRMEPHKKRMA
jgi:D-3-phosphoglycerate dehydrogenase